MLQKKDYFVNDAGIYHNESMGVRHYQKVLHAVEFGAFHGKQGRFRFIAYNSRPAPRALRNISLTIREKIMRMC